MDDLLYLVTLVRTQIVNQHDLARSQAGGQDLFNIGLEGQPIGGTRQDQRRPHPRERQRGDQGGIGRSVARHAAKGALLAWGTGIARREVHIRAALIDDHEIASWTGLQLLPEGGASGFIPFTGAETLFLRDQPKRVIARSRVARLIGRWGWRVFHHCR